MHGSVSGGQSTSLVEDREWTVVLDHVCPSSMRM